MVEKISLVILPIGSVIPLSIKAIIGMTTSPTSLFVSTRFGGQYCRPTPCGIWYLDQKPSIPTGESTKCLNLPILASEGDTKEISFKKKKENKLRRLAKKGKKV